MSKSEKKDKLSKKKIDGTGKKMIIVLSFFFFVLLIIMDQLSKDIIMKKYEVGEGKTVIKNVLEILHIRNKGSAWGMFEKVPIIPMIIACIMIGLLIYVYTNLIRYERYRALRICVICLVSGAIANIIDRIRLGSVTDFVYFKFINFPVFNVADIYVTFSIVAVLLLLIFKYSSEDVDVVLGSAYIDDNGKIIYKNETDNQEHGNTSDEESL
ncbi:signal peptidase II [Eubacterium ruminantium]|nr:signal peptidase II [Eubacterium ruminantium]